MNRILLLCATIFGLAQSGFAAPVVRTLDGARAKALLEALVGAGVPLSEGKEAPAPSIARLSVAELSCSHGDGAKADAEVARSRFHSYSCILPARGSEKETALKEAQWLWSQLSKLKLEEGLSMQGTDLNLRNLECEVRTREKLSSARRYSCKYEDGNVAPQPGTR